MANTTQTNDAPEHTMIHPIHRNTTDAEPAKPWVSAMASTNTLLREGSDKGKLLIFSGEADGVSRYRGFDDLWNPEGDCKVRIGNQDVCFDSKIIFETRSEDLIKLVSECVCGRGAHYHFRLPFLGNDLERVHNHSLAVRNFIATIVRRPIIGNTLVSALEDLEIIARHVFRLQSQSEKAIEFVQEYVQDLKLDNCTNRPADIGRFLAWTEKTRWSTAFVETFAHCVGMLNCGVLDHESLEDLSPTTRALLEHSCTHMHYCLTTVEMPMSTFGVDHTVLKQLEDHSGIRQSLFAFQGFLKQYYSQTFGKWPPPVHQNSGHWLTRSVVSRLQQDFGNLYDLLVDTDVHREMNMAGFAETFGCVLNRRQLFTSWNFQHGFHPLPHGDPKAPEYSPTMVVEQEEARGARRSSLIPAVQKHRKRGPDLFSVYSRATNDDIHVSSFCRAFLNHEASIKNPDIDTHDGRLGRWIIVYCMMQLLSKVAVDIQGLRYTQCSYFLNADLDGTPPWNPDDFPPIMRPAGPQYAWAAMFARAVGTPNRGSRSSQTRSAKSRFEVVQLDDGRVLLKDADGHVVFR